jgi:hypothetical protein
MPGPIPNASRASTTPPSAESSRPDLSSDLRTTLRKYGIDKPAALKDKVDYDGRLNAGDAIDFIVDLKAEREG